MKARVVIALLFARSVIHAMFAVRVSTSALGWTDLFREGAYYSLADGAVAGMIAVLLFTTAGGTTPDLLLRAGSVCDALIRIAGGIAILTLPGIPDFPVTVVILYGAVGATAAFSGIVALIVVIADKRRHRFAWPLDSGWSRVAFAAGGLAAVVIGWRLFARPPALESELRATAVAAAALFSVAFGLAAIGEERSLAK